MKLITMRPAGKSKKKKKELPATLADFPKDFFCCYNEYYLIKYGSHLKLAHKNTQTTNWVILGNTSSYDLGEMWERYKVIKKLKLEFDFSEL